MKMTEIRDLAKARGIVPGRMNKTDMVRTLQHQEGNAGCFRTGRSDTCGQGSCLWLDDCC